MPKKRTAQVLSSNFTFQLDIKVTDISIRLYCQEVNLHALFEHAPLCATSANSMLSQNTPRFTGGRVETGTDT